MRIICHLFFTIFILFELQKSATGNEKDGNGAIIDTKLVENNGSEDLEDTEEVNAKEKRSKKCKNFVGTNLFGDATGSPKNCFSSADVALLAARRDFESLLPKDLPNCLLDDELARLLMLYFCDAIEMIDKMTRGHSKSIAKKAFYDTLGGYLNFYIIPISKYSFYGGLVKLKTVNNILEVFRGSKEFLNTYGNGWRDPLRDFSNIDIQIEPLRIVIDNEDRETSCTQLELIEDCSGENEGMLVSLPHLDPEENGLLQNVWLPFKRKRNTFNLQSSKSAFVLLRYFELTTKCYMYQNMNQDKFNKKFKNWILENIEIHLQDDVLYPGLGAVLRIIETFQRKRRDSSLVSESKTNTKRQKIGQDFTNMDSADYPNPMNGVFQLNACNSLKYLQKEKERQRWKYIYIAIIISLLLVLLVFAVIAYSLFKKKKSKPIKPKKYAWFTLKKPKPKDDEEKLLNSKKKKSKKFSKKAEKPAEKQPDSSSCCGICSKKSKNSKKNPSANIETTSMDSDSEKDIKNKSKTPKIKPKATKSMVVNEKKRGSTSKKNKDKDGADKNEKLTQL